MEDRGISVSALLAQGLEFRVTHADFTYRAAATYGDILEIDTHVTARRASLRFHHLIRKTTERQVIVEGSATLVCVDTRGKVVRLPASLLAVSEERALTQHTVNTNTVANDRT